MDMPTPTPPPLRLLERPLRRSLPTPRVRPQVPAVEQAWWLRWLGLGQARKGWSAHRPARAGAGAGRGNNRRPPAV